jgi:hypothetical protein
MAAKCFSYTSTIIWLYSLMMAAVLLKHLAAIYNCYSKAVH